MVGRKGQGVPSHSQRASLLRKLLTLPSLLDVCSLYGCIDDDAQGSATTICQAMLALRPQLETELALKGPEIAENMENVCRACIHALSDMDHDAKNSLTSVKEGVQYLYDSCLTLCAVLKSLPLAASCLLKRDTSLLAALGVLHDQLVPDINSRISSNGFTAENQDLLRHCPQLEVASEAAAAMLLINGMLRPTDAGSSSSSYHVDSSAARALGEALIDTLSMLGIRESFDMGDVELSLVPALAQRYGLAAKIHAAVTDGIVSLDDAQSDYINALMQVPSSAAFPSGPVTRTEMKHGHEDTGMEALVHQVHDVLPHLGKGYIALCLNAFEGNPDRALNALLEGLPLPKEVAAVDHNLTWEEYQKLNGPEHKAGPTESRVRNEGLLASKPTNRQTYGQTDILTAKYLDTKDIAYHNIAKAEALGTQWEYEDEYDDSFDDLLHVGADGLADVEGDDNELAAKQGLETVAAVIKDLDLGETPASSSRDKRIDKRGSKNKLWVYQGKIYNYAKPGAQEVGSEAEARDVIRQAEAAAKEIHGLGPGGNKPVGTDESTSTIPNRNIRSGHQSTRGGARTGHHGWKDRQKAAIGNHHRKDRAAQKAGKGMM